MASCALLAQLKPGTTAFGWASLRPAVLTTTDALSQPVWHSPGAAPPRRAAFIAFVALAALVAFVALVAFGATASAASFWVVTAPSAILSVVTAPSLMFCVLTLWGLSFTAE